MSINQSAVPGTEHFGQITALGENVEIEVGGSATALIKINGTWTGNLYMEISPNETDWQSIQFFDVTNNTIQGLTTTNTMIVVGVGGATHMRVMSYTSFSGTADVHISCDVSPSIVRAISPDDKGFWASSVVKDSTTANPAEVKNNQLRVNDVADTNYKTDRVTVGTSEVEAKADTSTLTDRKYVTVYNDSSNTIYFGPTGVTTSTGEPLEKKQSISIPAGPNNAVYLIAGSASNDVIVQEIS